MTDVYNLTYDKLVSFLIANGEKKSKADMIFPAIYGRRVKNFDDIGLKNVLTELLRNTFYFGEIECIEKRESESADKYLFRLSDGNLIESVLMKHEYGNNICVSTQVGCNMGCAFCRSGRLKKIRNLETAEMIEQLLYVSEESGKRISGIAVMGIGEPLDNYESVTDFIDIAMYQKGFDIGLKHITLSTCGIVPKIYKLSESKNPVNLAVSLHAPTDELRNKLMPVNRKYSLSPLFEAIRHYSVSKNRRITLEYVMLKGINDNIECAEKLAELIGESNCYVNIIRYNESDGDSFECSDFDTIMKFYDVLKKHKIGVTMRCELGASVNAACGQLRADHIK